MPISRIQFKLHEWNSMFNKGTCIKTKTYFNVNLKCKLEAHIARICILYMRNLVFLALKLQSQPIANCVGEAGLTIRL